MSSATVFVFGEGVSAKFDATVTGEYCIRYQLADGNVSGGLTVDEAIVLRDALATAIEESNTAIAQVAS